MKKNKYKSKISFLYFCIFTIATTLFSACAPSSAPPQERVYQLKKNSLEPDTFIANNSAIWPENKLGSCERLEQLANEPVHKRSIFAFLARPFKFLVSESGYVEALGSLNLANSPLMQFVLTTPAIENRVQEVLQMSDEEFLKLGRNRLRVDECEKQNPRTAECEKNLSLWQGALGKFRAGLLYQEKPRGVERELERRFAGVFGSAAILRLGKDESLFLSLLDRIDLFKNENYKKVSPEDLEAILTLETPLFSKSRSWIDWLKDTEISIPAAIQGINNSENPMEKVCALVLWQRVFAQLLMIKGYEGPKLTTDGRLPILTENSTGIDKNKTYGAFLDSQNNKPLVLQPEDIAHYNPSAGNFWTPRSLAPVLLDREKAIPASLTDILNQLEAYVWIFAATSPAATWTMNKPYFLGDLIETDTALIPFQTNTLALGLISLTLKNLALHNILPVDIHDDKILTTGAGTGLILLANGKQNSANGEMHLYDLIRLTTSLVRLEDALEKIYSLAKENPTLLEQRSLVYEKEKNQIFPFYTTEKLSDLENLKSAIFRLKYPLAHRMIQMVESSHGCIAWETADYQNNGKDTKKVKEYCSEELLEEYKNAMRILAHNTRSILYYKKSL